MEDSGQGRVVGPRSTAGLLWTMDWTSEEARHRERLFAHVNLYQDDLPREMREALPGAEAGWRREFGLSAPLALGERRPDLLARLERGRWPLLEAKPRLGRFYPRQVLAKAQEPPAGAFLAARLTGMDPEQLDLDYNHPLAGREITLGLEVLEPDVGIRLAAPQPVDWLDHLARGPGMQRRLAGLPTDFYADDPFGRPETGPDPAFYQEPRLLAHLDSLASAHLTQLYAHILPRGAKVLDLMSSMYSHLPLDKDFAQVVGLGMNQRELEANPALDRRVVHDLNAHPALPFADGQFDAVVCASSLEYLIRPLEVLGAAARVLGPGGVLCFAFSNRWFPPKVVRIWSELHEFERLGLVLDYFLRAGGLSDLHTFSLRGWPRPRDDRHYPAQRFSDPLYAVWGRKA